MIACDLETSGLDWRVERIGTIQLFSPSTGTVILQASSRPPDLLAALMQRPSVVKVFHHAPFDLGFLQADWSITTRNVRCTKVASKLAFPEAPSSDHSLASLLRTQLGVAVAKGSVRTSDWMSSELTAEQIEYAANDVRFLLPLLGNLTHLLEQRGRLDLYHECCSFLPSHARLETGGFPDIFSY
ncbi:putative 3'-5' exonuclease [Blastococcus saxobsidens DD2]|uniref:Putative 3'-5' exonuclease n=2 Tax=Blastococcus saxobsidens TaxID=138336 RepID=H6RJE2_BLASD|nr:putative 3'-5' exonuclease [Blastococcus saxobsidens DD2]